MSFISTLRPRAEQFDKADLSGVTRNMVLESVANPRPAVEDFLIMLSPAARSCLEEMAVRARQLTLQYFGRTILLYTPLYLSNYCSNRCVYCGFNTENTIPRRQLSLDEVRAEAEAIAETGLKHILILTGEARGKASPEYIGQCAEVLAEYFSSISIEVYALAEDEYRGLTRVGVDGMTIYQETYNELLYPELHPAGPKRDFRFRLDAPERACRAGMHSVNIGALLGLDHWRRDAFLTGVHAAWLMEHFPGTDIAVSPPRMRPHAGTFQPTCTVSDPEMVQVMLAMRLFLPRVGMTISTRESATFRENILPLGVTKMSAGSCTAVGGHVTDDEQVGQFDINDERGVDEMAAVLRDHGYQPVFKDWHPL
jgi:2-iminoacetate synthase